MFEVQHGGLCDSCLVRMGGWEEMSSEAGRRTGHAAPCRLCREDLASESEMGSHWRILNRGVSQTDLCFRIISLAAIWRIDQKQG